MIHGLKVSKPGKDVKTADTKDLVFDSNINTLKTIPALYKTATTYNVTETVDGWDYYYVDLTHSLGYVPTFLEFHKHGTEWQTPHFGSTVNTTKSRLTWYGDPAYGDPDKINMYFFLRPFDNTAGGLTTASKSGIFSTEPGHKVKSGLPITDVTFDSNYEHWNILQELTFSVNITRPNPPTSTLYTWDSTKQAHGLSFTPAVIGSGKFYTNGVYRTYPYFETYDETSYRFAQIMVDSTNVWLRVTETFMDMAWEPPPDIYLDPADTVIVTTTVTARVKVFNAKLE